MVSPLPFRISIILIATPEPPVRATPRSRSVSPSDFSPLLPPLPSLRSLSPVLSPVPSMYTSCFPRALNLILEASLIALQRLRHARIPGVKVNSPKRHLPPRCHQETRRRIRAEVKTWLDGGHQHDKVFLITGPAFVGKSAIAQTVAEYCQDIGCLGGSIFFPDSNISNDPSRVIPTLAHQLANQYPEYAMLVAEELVENPTIVEERFSSQYTMLILSPFRLLFSRESIRRPWIFIIDGLEKCGDAQAQIVTVIVDNLNISLPGHVWMICSRSEELVSGLSLHPQTRRERLVINDTQSQLDVSCVLRDGFQDIRFHFAHLYQGTGEPWPPDAQFRSISRVASGSFLFASYLLRFIDDPKFEGPVARLQNFVDFIQNLGTIEQPNPIDLLYQNILLNISTDSLTIVTRILHFCVTFREEDFAAQDLANFLGHDMVTFYGSLSRLHSILLIPDPSLASSQSVRLLHSSLGDFLQDTGQFQINNVDHDIMLSQIEWYSACLMHRCEPEGIKGPLQRLIIFI